MSQTAAVTHDIVGPYAFCIDLTHLLLHVLLLSSSSSSIHLPVSLRRLSSSLQHLEHHNTAWLCRQSPADRSTLQVVFVQNYEIILVSGSVRFADGLATLCDTVEISFDTENVTLQNTDSCLATPSIHRLIIYQISCRIIHSLLHATLT